MKSVLIVGLGRFGRHIARNLQEMGHQIMALDTDEERVQEALPFVTSAQIGDCTNENLIHSLGVRNFDVCFVTIGDNFQSSLVVTSLLKEAGAKKVIARAARDIQAKFLLRNGADEVVYPEKQLARWMVIRHTSDHILDYIELDGNHGIYELTIPEKWIGKTVGALDIRRKFNINIMGTKKNGEMDLSITPDTLLTRDATMLVLGEIHDIQRCFHI